MLKLIRKQFKQEKPNINQKRRKQLIMTTDVQKKNYTLPIIVMIFLFAMIAFVTNLAAPIGVIWKGKFEGSNMLGMMGNLMNFAAYFFMGIPAGKLLAKHGYKKTALAAIVVGFLGIFTQYLSGVLGVNSTSFGLPTNFIIYLLGAFICGFSVCMLNTVVNPMLNTLAGGGNKGNQLIQVGGTFNSLAGTLTPLMVGAMIGQVTASTAMSNVNPLLFIAMGVFAFAFIILSMVAIPEPHLVKASTEKAVVKEKDKYSPWSFRHLKLGVIAIFIYVGIEIGVPGTLNFFLSDTSASGAGLDPANASAIGGSVAATYWFLMLVGRFIGSAIGSKISSKMMLTAVSGTGLVLVLAAIFSPIETLVSMPVFNGSAFGMVQVPINALFLVLCGLCTSIMWGGIFNLAVEGLGKYVATASGIFMMMVVGGGILPFFQNWVADQAGYLASYWVIVAGLAYLLYYALVGCKNVNKDIPVED